MPRFPTNPDDADVLSAIIGRLGDLETRDQTGPFCRLGTPSATLTTAVFGAFTWADIADPYGMVIAGIPTVPVRGWWRVIGAAGFAAAGSGTRTARITVNGTGVLDAGPFAMTTAGVVPIGDLLALEAGDEVRLGGIQTSGSNLAAAGGLLSVEWAHNRWD